MSSITVEIPPRGADPFLFRREFLHRVRLALSAAHIAGAIEAATLVELLRALPPSSTDELAA